MKLTEGLGRWSEKPSFEIFTTVVLCFFTVLGIVGLVIILNEVVTK